MFYAFDNSMFKLIGSRFNSISIFFLCESNEKQKKIKFIQLELTMHSLNELKIAHLFNGKEHTLNVRWDDPFSNFYGAIKPSWENR